VVDGNVSFFSGLRHGAGLMSVHSHTKTAYAYGYCF
jgi:hypothetical protein